LGCTFLHKGGGATPDNYRRGEKTISNAIKKIGHETHSINQATSIHIYRITGHVFTNISDSDLINNYFQKSKLKK